MANCFRAASFSFLLKCFHFPFRAFISLMAFNLLSSWSSCRIAGLGTYFFRISLTGSIMATLKGIMPSAPAVFLPLLPPLPASAWAFQELQSLISLVFFKLSGSSLMAMVRASMLRSNWPHFLKLLATLTAIVALSDAPCFSLPLLFLLRACSYKSAAKI